MFSLIAIGSSRWLTRLWILTGTLLCLSFVASPFVALASAAPATRLNQDRFAPWIDNSVPWDGNFAAFNTETTEKAGGACVFTQDQLNAYNDFKSTLQSDEDWLNERIKRKKNSPKITFRQLYQQRLRDGAKLSGTNQVAPDLSDDTMTRINQVKTRYFPKSNTVSSYEDFYFGTNSNSEISGCDQTGSVFKGIIEKITPGFATIFKNPGLFVMQVLFFPATAIALAIYNLISGLALGFTLTTPHSERGDTLFDSYGLYAKTAKKSQNANEVLSYTQQCRKKGNSSSGRASAASGCRAIFIGQKIICREKSSQNNTNQLGFDCNNALNAKKNQEKNAWILVANSLRSLLSGVYGMIVIAVALMYMFRRNAQSQMNVKTVLPRVFGAVLISVSAPFLIGALITMSNWTVQGLLAYQPDDIQAQLTQSILGLGRSDGGLDGAIASFFGALAVPVVIIFTTFFMLMLLFLAVGKQIALIGLIVMTPVACLGFVLPKWRGMFGYWARGIAAVCAIGPAQALILLLGLQMSSVFWSPS